MNSEFLKNFVLYAAYEVEHIPARSAASVDDKPCVLVAYLRSARNTALKSAVLYELARKISFGPLKNAAGTGIFERLGSCLLYTSRCV